MLCMRSPCVIDTRWQGTLLELNLAFLKYLFFRDGEINWERFENVINAGSGKSQCCTSFHALSRSRATSLSILPITPPAWAATGVEPILAAELKPMSGCCAPTFGTAGPRLPAGRALTPWGRAALPTQSRSRAPRTALPCASIRTRQLQGRQGRARRNPACMPESPTRAEPPNYPRRAGREGAAFGTHATRRPRQHWLLTRLRDQPPTQLLCVPFIAFVRSRMRGLGVGTCPREGYPGL